MKIQSILQTGQTSVSESASLLHHTHSNAQGKVATYYAHPHISKIPQFPINIFDRPAAVHGFVYALSWLDSRERGVVK